MRLALFFLVLCSLGVSAQQVQEDSLRQVLNNQLADSARVNVLNNLALLSLSHSIDSLLVWGHNALTLAREIDYQKGIAEAHKNLGMGYYLKGSYDIGLGQFIEALRISEKIGDQALMSRIRHNIGRVYFSQENYSLAVTNISEAYQIAERMGDSTAMATEQLSLCSCFENLGEPNRAIYYCDLSLNYFGKHGLEERSGLAYQYRGQSYVQLNKIDDALTDFWKAKSLVKKYNFNSVGCDLFREMADLYLSLGKFDSSRYYFNKTIEVLSTYDNKQSQRKLFSSLQTYYEKINEPDSALMYSKEYTILLQDDFKARVRDQLSSVQAYYELELNKNELRFSRAELKRRNAIISSISIGACILVVLLIIIWRFYAMKKKANNELTKLNNTISSQAHKLQVAHDEIQRINENLEDIVDERTLEIKEKNKILVEYAHSNAHKVRGPLARILGILSIIELTIHDEEIRDLSDRMHESARELDGVVREINQRLEE